MATLLSDWPYDPIDPGPDAWFQKGERVVYYDAPGTIVGVCRSGPSMWYVQLDENAGKGATRCHVSSIERCCDE